MAVDLLELLFLQVDLGVEQRARQTQLSTFTRDEERWGETGSEITRSDVATFTSFTQGWAGLYFHQVQHTSSLVGPVSSQCTESS